MSEFAPMIDDRQMDEADEAAWQALAAAIRVGDARRAEIALDHLVKEAPRARELVEQARYSPAMHLL